MALPPTTGAPLNLYVPPFDYGVNPGDDTYDVPENANTVAINAFAATVVLYSPTANQTIAQPGGTFFNFNSPIVYGATPSLLFGTAANIWDSSLTRTAEGAFTLDSNSAGNAAATLKLNVLNAVTGLQVNSEAPLNYILVGNGNEYVGSATLPAGLAFYQTIQSAGVPVSPQRSNLNFLAPFTVTDDSGNGSTDVGLTIPVTNVGFAIVTGERSFNTVYHNTSGHLMDVRITVTDNTGGPSGGTATAMIGATASPADPVAVASAIQASGGSSAVNAAFSFMVPVGYYYEVAFDVNLTITKWTEYTYTN